MCDAQFVCVLTLSRVNEQAHVPLSASWPSASSGGNVGYMLVLYTQARERERLCVFYVYRMYCHARGICTDNPLVCVHTVCLWFKVTVWVCLSVRLSVCELSCGSVWLSHQWVWMMEREEGDERYEWARSNLLWTAVNGLLAAWNTRHFPPHKKQY